MTNDPLPLNSSLVSHPLLSTEGGACFASTNQPPPAMMVDIDRGPIHHRAQEEGLALEAGMSSVGCLYFNGLPLYSKFLYSGFWSAIVASGIGPATP